MKPQLLAPTMAVLTLCSTAVATRHADASPVFGATATLTNPTPTGPPPNSGPKQDHIGSNATSDPETLTATNVTVSVQGGTPNGSMNVQYALSMNWNGNQAAVDTNATDQFQIILLDTKGSFKRPYMKTPNGDVSAAVNLPTPQNVNSFNIDAIADIYDLRTPSQGNHADSGGSILAIKASH